MGCILCNIITCEEFKQGIKNPFYCKFKKERDRFSEELAYDIAINHPKIVRKINEYAKKAQAKRNGGQV